MPPANVRSKRPLTFSFYAIDGTGDANYPEGRGEVDFAFMTRAQDELLAEVINALTAFGNGRCVLQAKGPDGTLHHEEEFARHGLLQSLHQFFPPPDDGPRTA